MDAPVLQRPGAYPILPIYPININANANPDTTAVPVSGAAISI
jgi:hypothetical protein